MSDCGGLIRDLALALPASFLAEDAPDEACAGLRLLVPIANLLSSLPCDLRVHVFVDRPALESARLWLERASVNCQVNLVPVGSDYGAITSPWIQDLIHVRTCHSQGEERIEIVARPSDVLAGAIASHLSIDYLPDGLAVPGGNHIVGQGFRLVGSSHTGCSGFGKRVPHDTTDIWRKISGLDDRRTALFGYRVANLGPTARVSSDNRFLRDRIHQPGFHVDQFVTVTGLFFDDRPLLLVADPMSVEARQVAGGQMLKRQLDASVVFLEDQGFAVERNPVPLAVVADTGKRLPRLYNNVLLENAFRPQRTRPQVWVPQYGDMEDLEEFDRQNLEVWTRLGFEPIPVPGWSYLASRNGAIRCVTKILRRDEM